MGLLMDVTLGICLLTNVLILIAEWKRRKILEANLEKTNQLIKLQQEDLKRFWAKK